MYPKNWKNIASYHFRPPTVRLKVVQPPPTRQVLLKSTFYFKTSSSPFSTSIPTLAPNMRLEAGNVSEWQDGMMKEIPLDPKADKSPKILVSKVMGKIHATSSQCTHYGASLINGVLASDGCLTCPWHGAKFSVCKDGDIEDAPGLNALQSFTVLIEDERVFVEVDPELVKATQFGRTPAKCKSSGQKAKDQPGVVVIGGGSGGHYFVEEIRRLNYNGNVTLISQEPNLPIDRTKLSKALITDPKKIAFRDEAFYRDTEIDLQIGKAVNKIDVEGQSVSLSDGSTIKYSKLVVATGGIPRTLPLDGADLEGISIMRAIPDAQKIQSILSGASPDKKKTIALIGSSFISMELAIFAAKKENVQVHVIGMDKIPLSKILGDKIGNAIKKSHEKNGVVFHLEANLEKFLPSESNPSHVGGVALKGGEVVKCDGVVLGVGVMPNTDLLKAAGIALEKDGSVVVDEYLRIKDSKARNTIYAIGDIAKYPDLLTDGALVRIEHWNVAGNHARAAAKNIAQEQKSEPLVAFTKPAIFWSAQGEQLRYVGTGKASQWQDVIIEGNADELNFVAYYYKDDEVVAIATMKKDPMMVQAAELFARKKFPSVSEIRKGMNLMSLKL
ncbi:hypothetical protein PGT21_030179 [Puccinia graminis f. sp. tritici]|uniref:Rieske domain-containing protein n=1 Tax=Puccinia graminis f. sp. tritici TaxID=56615 RepID=A0A5B0MQ76_PUCGR|nr:hypothetical protein PGT21_030179 [Puccinia graminis f. sp. tritici]